jgi:ATP-dependent DNA helicase RecG
MKRLNADDIRRLCAFKDETPWLEFKTNWFEPEGLGQYISSLSNAAALCGVAEGYLLWGIADGSHEIIGTDFNYLRSIKNEPLEHFYARQISPSIAFSFEELSVDGKRLVVLRVPSANRVPTSFDHVRYIRIGSSKENAEKYPDREGELWTILRYGYPTVVNTKSPSQNLSFSKFLVYCAAKGFDVMPENFEKNFKLKNDDGQYNILAYILSDKNDVHVRVSTFNGKAKSDPLYSVTEYGCTCIFYAMDSVLEFGKTINIMQADETDRVVERKDVPLFDSKAYREAVINAFVHNYWLGLNGPQISVFSNRIEILSHGSLAPKQNLRGFYIGESVPVNQALSDIYLQLRISERSGRGVPKITKVYGKDAFDIDSNFICVTIPFNRIRTSLSPEEPTNKPTNKPTNDGFAIKLTKTQQKILEEMRDNPNVTISDLEKILSLKQTAIKDAIRFLKKSCLVERRGTRKNGFWVVNENWNNFIK